MRKRLVPQGHLIVAQYEVLGAEGSIDTASPALDIMPNISNGWPVI
jgi:hypothetical protein